MNKISPLSNISIAVIPAGGAAVSLFVDLNKDAQLGLCCWVDHCVGECQRFEPDSQWKTVQSCNDVT